MNQVTMDMKRYMKALPAMAALLLTAACSSSEDIETVETPQPAKERIIHFTAKVNNEDATRATLDGTQYNFVSGDKLYVWGTNISGVLTMDSYGTTSSVFSGDLTYTGDEPTGTIPLNAVVKGPSDQILGTFEEFKASGYNPSYTTGLASSLKDAVEKFSYLKASANYDFTSPYPCYFGTPQQQSAFVSFDITLEDGTAAGENITVTINNGGSDVCSGSVTTVNESGAIKAQFTAAFAGETTLSGAKVKLGDRDAISFASSNPTLTANKNYTVTKFYKRYTMTASATVPDISIPTMSINITGGEKTKTFKIESFPYNLSLATLLSEYDESYAFIASLATCEHTSGDNVSVSEKPYIFTVTGTGTSIFNVQLLTYSIPVTITVTE